MDEHGGDGLLVSIVIPVYNGANYLAQAIDSALAQTWPHTEVIVVDDGSDDAGQTARIAARYGDRIRYHHKANGGVATAINTGIALMRGRYFSWLSHDDVFTPDKIERQIRALLAYGEPALAFGDYGTMDADGGSRVEYGVGHIHTPGQPLLGLMHYMVNGCAVLVHRDCLQGLWLDPGLPSTQDYDLWIRIACRFPLVHVPGIAVYSRQHAAQGSRSARFLDEVLLLWLSVLDRVDAEPEARQCLMGEVPDFARMLESYAVRGLPALRPTVQARMAAQARGCSVAVVVAGTFDAGDCERLADALSQAGVVLCGIWAARPAWSALQEMRLQWPEGREVRLHLSAGGADEPAHALLSRASVCEEAEFVWLLDAAAPSTDMLGHALPPLCARPAAVVCLQAGRTQDVLAGAVFRRTALQSALAQAPERLGALVHALVREGDVLHVTLPAAAAMPQAATAPAVAEAKSTQPTAPACGGPSLPMRISFALQRRPAWAGLVWRLMRAATGRKARGLLLRWTGLQGQMDADWYLRAYPEVAGAGIDPVFHYLLFGQREGRDPSPAFDTLAYLGLYPQVRQQGLNALQHHVAWGRAHGYQVQASSIGPQPPELADARPAVLLVLDGRSDDAVRFAHDLALQLASKVRVLYLSERHEGSGWVFGGDPRGECGRRLDAVQHKAVLGELLLCHGVVRTLVLDHGGFDAALPDVMAALASPYDLVLLARAPDGDAAVLARRLSGPDRRRLRTGADTVFAASQALAGHLRGEDASLAVTVAPPPDPHRLRGFRPWVRPIGADTELRIALFGLITEAAGREVLLDMLRDLRTRPRPVRLVLFGQVSPALPSEIEDGLQMFPALNGTALVERIVATRPHLAWFPCQAQVDNGYALTDAESAGLPMAASDVGEASERLAQRPLSWLLPAATTVAEWLAWFELWQHRSCGAGPGAVPEPFSQRFYDADVYRRHLLARISDAATETPCAAG
ncbi:MAG TPA: glycosyltransferase [Pseudorhodoferax sp.]|jgi:hypothetical protein|nr:glycosyltransferase [Pseudorhodoferax sp.]